MQPKSPEFLQLSDTLSINVAAIRRIRIRRESGTVHIQYIGGGDDLLSRGDDQLEGDTAAAFLRWYNTDAQVHREV